MKMRMNELREFIRSVLAEDWNGKEPCYCGSPDCSDCYPEAGRKCSACKHDPCFCDDPPEID